MDMQIPRITAADIKAAAVRLAGTVILDVAGVVSGPAVYSARLAAFVSIDNTDAVLADDDGSVIDLLAGIPARELVAEHGTPGKAAQAVNARIKREWGAA
jgi:hypothetical protein